jgi:hypothetical protein
MNQACTLEGERKQEGGRELIRGVGERWTLSVLRGVIMIRVQLCLQPREPTVVTWRGLASATENSRGYP